MASLTEIKQAVAARLVSIFAERAYAAMPNNFFAPGVIVLLAGQEPMLTLGNSGLTRYDLELLVAVSMSQPGDQAQAQLDGFTSDSGLNSIRAAVMGDSTLGGKAHSCFPGAWLSQDVETIGDIEFWGQRLPLRVWTG